MSDLTQLQFTTLFLGLHDFVVSFAEFMQRMQSEQVVIFLEEKN
jgi:hypothetical protein